MQPAGGPGSPRERLPVDPGTQELGEKHASQAAAGAWRSRRDEDTATFYFLLPQEIIDVDVEVADSAKGAWT